MNTVKAQLMGEREDLKQKDMAAILAGKAAADAIKNLLARASVVPLEKIDTKQVLHHAKELDAAAAQHRELMEKIEKINEELG